MNKSLTAWQVPGDILDDGDESFAYEVILERAWDFRDWRAKRIAKLGRHVAFMNRYEAIRRVSTFCSHPEVWIELLAEATEYVEDMGLV